LRTIIIEWIYILQIDKDRDVREMAVCDEIPSIYESTESYQKILNDFSNNHNILVLEKIFKDNNIITSCSDSSNAANNNKNNNIVLSTETYGDINNGENL